MIFVHNNAWYYQKKFIGADGKPYLMNGVLAVKSGICPVTIVKNWNNCYRGATVAPYTLLEEIPKNEMKRIKDNNGRSLKSASDRHYQSSSCAIVLNINEVQE